MKLYHKLYQDVFFRGLDFLRGRKNIERLKFLRQSQYWERNKLEKWQLSKLNALLETAKKHSSFYSSKLEHINLPLYDLKELSKIPVLTKEELRHNFKDILCDNVNPESCELSKTGGSTGEPSYYYLDKESKDWNRGSVYRSAEWAGSFLGDMTVIMMGSHYDYHEFQKLKSKFTLFLQRYKDLSVAFVDDNLLDKYYHQVVRCKPTSIWGYASGLFLFAEFIKKNYPMANFDFVNAIITSSETLQPQWREAINNVFGSGKVYDHYGSREMYIASECSEHNGYHIHEENILLDVVDKDGNSLPDGQLGRIIVTDLTNLAFPFIRYEIGDIGIKRNSNALCPCGLKLPILEKIEGRMGDVIILKNRVLTPPNFTILMSDIEGIDSYQIIQESIERLLVKIVKNSKYNKKTEQYIEQALEKLTDGEIEIDITSVDQISVPKSGKHRFIFSKISMDLL